MADDDDDDDDDDDNNNNNNNNNSVVELVSWGGLSWTEGTADYSKYKPTAYYYIVTYQHLQIQPTHTRIT
jgi:hypothetical protein